MSTPRFFDEHGKEIHYEDVENFTEIGECRVCGQVAGLDVFPACRGMCEECRNKAISAHLNGMAEEIAAWLDRT